MRCGPRHDPGGLPNIAVKVSWVRSTRYSHNCYGAVESSPGGPLGHHQPCRQGPPPTANTCPRPEMYASFPAFSVTPTRLKTTPQVFIDIINLLARADHTTPLRHRLRHTPLHPHSRPAPALLVEQSPVPCLSAYHHMDVSPMVPTRAGQSQNSHRAECKNYQSDGLAWSSAEPVGMAHVGLRRAAGHGRSFVDTHSTP